MDNVEELPICKEIRAKETVILKERLEKDEDYEYLVKTEDKLQKKIAECFKNVKLTPALKNGAVVVSTKHLTDVIVATKKLKREHMERKQNTPQLIVDCKEKTASYNGNELNLFPNIDDARRDAMNIIDYSTDEVCVE